MADTTTLSKDQRAALEKLRNAVSDILNSNDCNDDYLLTWLREHNFNAKKSESMLRSSIEWRKKHKIDDLVDKWTPPEVMIKYLPHGMCGWDKEGSPILIFPLKNCDVKGILQSVSKEDFMYYIWYLVEKSKREMQSQSQQRGRSIMQHNVIIDVEGFDVKSMLWKQAIDTVRAIIGPSEANYPDIIKKVFIINAPGVITFIYNMFKPFLSTASRKRVCFYGSDRSKWVETLLEHIDADQLPKHWGGNCVDPDGNIFCSSKIVLGKEVPKSYYLVNKENAQKEKPNEVLTVGQGESTQLEFAVEKCNSKLRYAFQTEDYDIGFKVDCKLKEVVPYSRVNSHCELIEGEVNCEDIGKYTVTFDNSFSKMRSKTLYYSIEVIPPNQ